MAKKKKASYNELELTDVSPLTENQKIAFNSKKNLVLCGSAGAGKSFIACYLGFKGIADRQYSNLVIIRSAVPTRDIGFLPGNDKEKASIYELPYHDICSEIFNRGDSYDVLKTKGIIKFITTSYVRGITLLNSVIVVDEIQNMSYQELDSLITRVGEGCKIIFCGDFKQADLKNNGMKSFLSVLSGMNSNFDIVDFTIDDVVRSEFVKDYLTTKEKLGL